MPIKTSKYLYLCETLENLPKGNECVEWPYALTASGRGQLHIPGDRARLVHRVAYELWFGSIPEGLDICHHCDNPKCYRPSHLFAGTAKDNMQDCSRKGRFPFRGGVNCPTSKLSESDVHVIRNLYASGLSQDRIGKHFGVTKPNIRYIVKGKNWKHLNLPDLTVGRPPRVGILHGGAKLSERDVREIRKLSTAGIAQRQIAQQFAVNPMTINKIIRGITWKHH